MSSSESVHIILIQLTVTRLMRLAAPAQGIDVHHQVDKLERLGGLAALDSGLLGARCLRGIGYA